MNLKAEAIGLAVKTELPLIITDIQRAGPSTGMPTKPEQADLLWRCTDVMASRRFRFSPPSRRPIVSTAAYEAVRIAIKYMTPVILLTDGQLANGAEPWLLPDTDKLPPIQVDFATDPEGFMPYSRDRRHSRAPWAIPGTPGLEHRIGGLSTEDLHRQRQLFAGEQRADGPARARAKSPASPAKFRRRKSSAMPTVATLLVLGWGSTYGSDPRGRQADARQWQKRVAHPSALSESAARPTSVTSSVSSKK